MKLHLGWRELCCVSFRFKVGRPRWLSWLGLVVGLLGSPGLLRAQVPSVVSHLGFVEVNGVPFHGEGRFKFALISGSGPITSHWSHDGTSVAGSEPATWVITNLVHGRYAIPLGNTNVANMTAPLLPTAVAHSNAVLRVWFSDGVIGFQQLVPDQPLLAVPYALQSATLVDNAVGSAQLAPNAVLSGHILDGTIVSLDLADGTIATGDIADGAITSPKILDGTILSADLADGAVTSAKILDGTIASADVANGTLTLTDLSLASVDTRYVLKAGDTMTGKLTASGGIATSSITNNVGVLSLVSRTDIELTIDNGGGANASFEIFNSSGNHLYLLSETGSSRTFGTHAIDSGLMVGTTALDANALAQINLPSSVSVPHLRIKSPLGDNGFGIQFVNPEETWYVGPNIGNWPDDRFNILADSSNKGLIIAANGNVAIDSVSAASPFAKLTIDGSIGFPTVATPAMYIYPSGVANAEKAVIVHSPAYDEWGLYYNDVGDRFLMKSAAGDTTPSLVVDLGNNWVAIGTETPKPGYHLSVDGKIVCEELLVEDSADWPDYVFQEDYRLQSLEEVEAHIKERKHLPGVPTAAEISKNGLPLGEMQKRMMEKIEELTLHLIEQNKRMTSQDERIRHLEAQLRQQTTAPAMEAAR